MGALRIASLASALLLASPAMADPVDRWSNQIAEASSRFGIPGSWIKRVIRAESGGYLMLNGRPIRSSAGAQGLMQLMPSAWQDMRLAYGLGFDPYDPRDNILAGTAYLRAMYDRFGYPGLFAAYNAGPARYAEHLATGKPLPSETVTYLAAITGMPPERALANPAQGHSHIFITLAQSLRQNIGPDPRHGLANALFVRLTISER